MNEAAFFWILGAQSAIVLGLLGIVYARQNNHETHCLEWQRKFMEEHGALKASIEILLRKVDER